MKRVSFVAVLLAIVWGQAGPVGQPLKHRADEPSRPIPIAVGVSMRGKLSSQSPKLRDGSRYDFYIYRGAPEERLLVTVASKGFIELRAGNDPDSSAAVVWNGTSGGAGRHVATLVARTGPDGTVLLWVISPNPSATGAYSLVVEPHAVPTRQDFPPLTVAFRFDPQAALLYTKHPWRAFTL